MHKAGSTQGASASRVLLIIAINSIRHGKRLAAHLNAMNRRMKGAKMILATFIPTPSPSPPPVAGGAGFAAAIAPCASFQGLSSF